MIINIRGTSGSGKSTIARGLLDSNPRYQIWGKLDGIEELLRAPDPHDPLYSVTQVAHAEGVFARRKEKQELLGYEVLLGKERLRIVGKYETPCGGCDGIKTQDMTEQRVRRWHADGHHVLFEGLLISHIYGRWAQLAKDVGRSNMLFAFLDTPLDVCLDRVRARRAARGNDKPLDETNTRQKWEDARRVFAKCQADGLLANWYSGDDLFALIHSGEVFKNFGTSKEF